MTEHADLLVEGRIATLAGERGLGWVEAVAVRDGRVAAAGRRADLEALVGPGTRRLPLAPDEVAIPGLTDAHVHLADGGIAADDLDLTPVGTLQEALAALAALHARRPAGAWLSGHGWDVDRWGEWPTADALEAAAPGRPATIWAHDHHALWVNRSALAAAGVDERTADPPGGVIRRDTQGRPTGVLHETAARLVTSVEPEPTVDDLERGIARIGAEMVALGVVAVHDPGGLSLVGGLGPAFEAYRRLAERSALPLRVHACVREEQLDAAIVAGLASGDAVGPAGGRLRFGWLKLFADGTLGSRTAALLEPIEPEPDRPLPPDTERGVWMTPPDELTRLVARAAAHGITCQIHAIGDAAVRASLDALAATGRAGPGASGLRPRLEHVQLADPVDLGRFAALGIAASVQPIHLRSDAAVARRLWGDRAEANGYPWRRLAESGALLPFGTDAPVEPIDPWPGLEIAVTRRSADWAPGTEAFGPANGLSLDRAFRAQALDGPLSAGEHDRGRLVARHRADLVVIPADALGEPVETGGPLGRVRPRLVLIDGAVAAER